MARPKIPRKSTIVDMTAMCDVAFLLLSFFILTTKFKPDEAVAVQTPSSVSSKVAPEKNIVLVTIDATGKVFLSMDDKDQKIAIAEELNKTKNLNIDANAFAASEFIGAPFSQLASAVKLPKEQQKGNLLPGIPADSTKGANEMVDWMTVVNKVYQGKPMNLLLKGDNSAKYPSFKGVIDAFKKNDFLKFQMVTNPEAIPNGTDLWKDNNKTGAIKEKS